MNRARPVGVYFFDSILSDLDSLILFAGVHPIYFGFHRMLSKRFPFGIYYEMEDEMVYVYAILDLRRDPLWIRKRAGEKVDELRNIHNSFARLILYPLVESLDIRRIFELEPLAEWLMEIETPQNAAYCQVIDHLGVPVSLER